MERKLMKITKKKKKLSNPTTETIRLPIYILTN